MPRNHGRILSSILTDKDFQTLSEHAQRLYFVLLAQPDLNTAGVLSINYRRWAGTCATTSEQHVRKLSRELDERRYVLFDNDTEEAFIRSLMRNDGITKQPQMLTNALRVARQVISKRLRTELAAELRRIGMVITKEVADEIDPPENEHDPPEVATGSSEVATGSSRAGQQRLPRKGGAAPSDTGSPSPVQADGSLPAASPQAAGRLRADGGVGVGVGVGEAVTSKFSSTSVSTRAARAARLPDDFAVTQTMAEWARREHPHVDGRRETAKFVDYWRAASGQTARKLDWDAAWRNWIRKADEQLADRAGGRHLAPVNPTARLDPDAAFADLRMRGAAAEAARLAGLTYVPPSQPPSDPTEPRAWRHARNVEWIDAHTEPIRAALRQRPAG